MFKNVETTHCITASPDCIIICKVGALWSVCGYKYNSLYFINLGKWTSVLALKGLFGQPAYSCLKSKMLLIV